MNRIANAPGSLAIALLLAVVAFSTDVVAQGSKSKAGERLRKALREDGWEVGPPKDALDDESFVEHRGKFCIVRTTVSRKAAKDIAEFTDIYLYFFSKIFSRKFRIPGKLIVVVFGHDEEFTEYYRNVYGDSTKPRGAVYSPSRKESWVTLQGKGNRKKLPLETTKHELTHHMLHFFTGRASLPPWFNEGTACFFQYWDISESMKTNIAKNLDRAKTGDYGYFPTIVRRAYRTSKFVPPTELLALSYASFHAEDPDLERLHYSESWALVNFLTTTKTGQRFFNKIVQSLSDGKKLDDVLVPKTMDSLKKAWYRDIEKRVLPRIRTK